MTRADAHARAGRHAEAVGANAAFHDALIDLAGSRVLSSIIEPVAGRMAWLLNQHTIASSRAAVTSLDTDA